MSNDRPMAEKGLPVNIEIWKDSTNPGDKDKPKRKVCWEYDNEKLSKEVNGYPTHKKYNRCKDDMIPTIQGFSPVTSGNELP